MAETEKDQTRDEAAEEKGNGPAVADGGKRDEKKAKKAEAKLAKSRKLKEESSGFSLKRLHWAELVGFLGSAVLGLSLFLPWFATDCPDKATAAEGTSCNPNSVYNGVRGDFTAFQTFKYLDWMLVAACVAPFVLAYIIARGHALSWKPGEVTMIVGMLAFALIVLNGLILGKPGDTVDMGFRIGWLIGLLGAGLIMFGGILRQALVPATRTPPGVM